MSEHTAEPSPWSPEQAAALQDALRRAPASESTLAALRGVVTWVGSLHEIASAANSRLAALQALLVEKGLLTREEIETTLKRMNAEHKILASLDPDITALEEQMKRLAREGTETRPDEEA
jgi:hypothetical protein